MSDGRSIVETVNRRMACTSEAEREEKEARERCCRGQGDGMVWGLGSRGHFMFTRDSEKS